MFTYQSTKSGTVLIFWNGRQVATLTGRAATSFLTKIDQADDAAVQRIMAAVTGNFRRGNERQPGSVGRPGLEPGTQGL